MRIFALIISCVLAPAALAQGDIRFESTEVAPGIHMLQGVGGFAGGNLGLLTGDDGAILIDDGMLPLFDKTYAAISEQVGGKVDFVVNTHAHGDHVGGNKGLSEAGATIIAHDRLRQRLVEEGVTGPDGQMPATAHWLPEVTFNDAVTLHLNGQRVHVFHVANAHTDGDSIVHFPDADVIHAGDVLFNGLFPYIDLDSGGSVDGYIAAQRKIIALAGDKTKIISGHGPLASKKDVQAANDMLADACERVKKLVDAGKSADQIVKMNPLADYADDWSWGFINAERLTRTLVRDLQGTRKD